MLPSSWVDRIFAKLTLVYGHDFLRRWEGFEIDAVKADWAHELGGFVGQPKCITYAIENVDPAKPPTAKMFRALCNAGPLHSDAPALGFSGSDAAPEVRERLRDLIAKMQAGSHPHTWAYRLKAKRSAGERLSLAQTEALERFDRNTGSLATAEFDGAGFTPIPAEQWPWNTAA